MFGSVPTASRAAGFVSRCLAMWSVCLACLTLDVGRLLAIYRSSAFWFTALRTVPRFSQSGLFFPCIMRIALRLGRFFHPCG